MENQLTERQILACQYIADGIADDFIAKELDVTFKTLKHWRDIPEFRQFVNQLTLESESQVATKIMSLKPAAVVALQELLEAKDARTRLKAAEVILRYGVD